MTAIAKRSLLQSGLRPMDVRRDLSKVASLIELCFGDSLDASGRSAIREKKALSRYGALLHVANVLLPSNPAWQLGFVWIDNGRLVGNVGVQPSGADRSLWLIANVAVHPEFRRRGIAQQLMGAALDLAAGRGARVVVLQVEAGNAAALKLYEGLGFETRAVRTTWQRRSRQIPHAPAAASANIRLAAPTAWESEYALLQKLRPDGLAWGQPLIPGLVKPSFGRSFGNLISGRREERWVAGAADPLQGWVRLQANLGRADRLALVVQSEQRERLARPLLIHALRRLGRRPWLLQLEHPAGELHDLLQEFQFRAIRTLRWMRLQF